MEMARSSSSVLYLEGTTEQIPMGEILVQGSCDHSHPVCLGLTPVKARPGKPLSGRLIFVDQFNGKHKSDKITFRPNTLPAEYHANRLKTQPNCAFCGKRVDLRDQAAEAQMTAHTNCIWPQGQYCNVWGDF
jgi:hypothetical protein